MMSLSMSYGYFGIFLISLVGGLSIFIPFPDTLVIYTLAGLRVGGTWVFGVLWIATAAGIGSAVGEFSGYLLGLGGREAIIKRFERKIDFLKKILDKFGSMAIFLFALTPLPDDLIFIPLGIMRYNVIKAFIPALIGKFLMNLIVAYSGRFLFQFVANFFSVGNDWVPALIATFLGVITFILMFKVDWEKYLEKYVR
jgi:membrane protein YqaA with SNARE-associated domain